MFHPAEFAREVVQKLDAAGYRALWAGGCVRDQLMGRHPKDYDVATNATPEEVRALFGRRRTLMIGASFGVVAVLGPRPSRGAPPQQVEIATFRRDEGYSDGRRPDQVCYSTPEQDALRRDFTINGLFYDPLRDEVIDYVGGREDLRGRLVRCIGDPAARFAEDRLRMLRAIRFATLLDFTIDPGTFAAIHAQAEHLQVVSAERIAAELRRILTHPNASRALREMQASRLNRIVLPEFDAPAATGLLDRAGQLLDTIYEQATAEVTFPEALAATLTPISRMDGVIASVIAQVARRWKLTNREHDDTLWLLTHLENVFQADQLPWPELQPLIVDRRIRQLLALARAVVAAETESEHPQAGIELCENKLSLPPAQLDPAPLVGGHDLIQAGVPPGRRMGKLLAEIRRLQLLGRLASREDAIRWLNQQSH